MEEGELGGSLFSVADAVFPPCEIAGVWTRGLDDESGIDDGSFLPLADAIGLPLLV